MHDRMSARTQFLCYFTPRRVTDQQVASFTDTDDLNSVVLVAELGGQIIAAGTYFRNTTGDPDAAEVAFVVQDSTASRPGPGSAETRSCADRGPMGPVALVTAIPIGLRRDRQGDARRRLSQKHAGLTFARRPIRRPRNRAARRPSASCRRSRPARSSKVNAWSHANE